MRGKITEDDLEWKAISTLLCGILISRYWRDKPRETVKNVAELAGRVEHITAMVRHEIGRV